jgi:hypothetical protein
MTSTVVQIENDVFSLLKTAATDVGGAAADFEAFFAHNGSPASQAAITNAVTAIQGSVSTVEQAILPIADDVVTYALSKVPGGAVVGPAAISLFNAIAQQLLSKAAGAVTTA